MGGREALEALHWSDGSEVVDAGTRERGYCCGDTGQKDSLNVMAHGSGVCSPAPLCGREAAWQAFFDFAKRDS